MGKLSTKIKLSLNYIRCFPHIIMFYCHRNRSVIHADTVRWLQLLELNTSQINGFVFLLAFFPEYRNLFYCRIGISRYFLNIFCPKISTLYLRTKKIGSGLFIQHGFSTGIDAESIGKNCWINQQVTIGFYKTGNPTILDNVTIRAGAVITGKITVGNNVVIGANATVFENVPDNCTVFAPPSRIMHWNPNNKTQSVNDSK